MLGILRKSVLSYSNMNDKVTYRWLHGLTCSQEDWDKLDSILSVRRWMALSRDYSRILVAEQNEEMAFCVFQGLPYCGPLFVPPKMRGTGIAQKLANDMIDTLLKNDARGWMAVAESPHAVKMCEARGMVKVDKPVYMMPYTGGLEI